MQILSILLAQLAISPVTATGPAAPDTAQQRAERAVESSAAPAMAVDFGKGPGAPLPVRSIQFELAERQSPDDRRGATARVEVTRVPDSLSAVLAARVGSGEPIPAMVLRLPGGGGAPGLILRLSDVRVMSTRLAMTGDTLGLVQQRLGLEESITQLTADLAEARRQYGVAESLEKQRLSASLDLARARGTVEALTARLASQEERRGLIVQQLANWSPVQEQLVLLAGRGEVQASAH